MEESERNHKNPEETNPTVIRSIRHSTFHTLTAMIVWLGSIHLNIILALLLILLFPNTSAFWYVGKYAPGYFPVTVHIEDAKLFDRDKAYILVAEPHSIFPIGYLSLLNITGLMPLSKTKALASTAVFYTPFLRQIGIWLGLVPATKKNFVKYLEAGYSCILIPGGVQEIIYMNREFEVAFLKKRFGFVRVSIETGAPLVPVFCFGQSDVYSWWKPDGKLYHRIARAIRFAPLIFWGGFGSPIPYCRPIQVVVGRPIEIKQNPCPSNEEVAEVHARFVSAFHKLFLRYREITGCADTQIRIM
ncbi:diacylglycerol O-acyltransferase 2D-like isoform X2 [Magnolia sinica]|uniref:diacylglycerol O-acyltransferase 2D-like isoform X2 n=1 Tax=Magnolia sinica TaxID=86752 RepID=UPI00265A916C|nr:diacylglycerol O-acyltransferase 2D-like isoform X2 [Magnolia sinica]